MAATSDSQKQWYMATVLETCANFDVQMKKGLTTEQVKERARVLPKKRRPSSRPTPKIEVVFWAVLIVMLVLASSVYTLESTVAVLVFVLSACLLGAFAFAQQGFVRHIVLVIAKKPVIQVRVRRNGALCEVPADTVVPGDIFVLQAGDYVSANLRVLEVKDLYIDESEATGQTIAVQKNTFTLHKKTKPEAQANMISAGSFVQSGTGLGIVVELPEHHEKFPEIPHHSPNKKQEKRMYGVLALAFLAGLSVVFWGVSVVSAFSLSALLVFATYYYAKYWLQYVTWASLYDQAVSNGMRFKDFKRLMAFAKTDMVFLDAPKDFVETAAFIHQLQAELRIEVRAIVKKSDVSKLEKELNISGSALTYKEFMGATRANKIKKLHDYQLLVGFDDVALAEAVSLMQQAGHYTAWVDDTKSPLPASTIAEVYISQSTIGTVQLQQRSDCQYTKQISLKRLAAFFDAKVRFKNITAY